MACADGIAAFAKDGGAPDASAKRVYKLEDQIGFLLRQVSQRHASIFFSLMPDGLTPTQWAVMAKLSEEGQLSQNLLGRLTAMDAATVKGVVDRLMSRSLVTAATDPDDARRLVIALTPSGAAFVERATAAAFAITEETLAPLEAEDRRVLQGLLMRLT